jgi:DNA-binding NtrC family response regulator
MELEQALSDAGYQIFGSVAKTERALDLLAKGRPDAALLDIRLNNGEVVYPVANALAALGIPFALMTGYTSEAIDARFGGCIVLHKPFSDDVALAAIKRLLDGAAPGQQ